MRCATIRRCAVTICCRACAEISSRNWGGSTRPAQSSKERHPLPAMREREVCCSIEHARAADRFTADLAPADNQPLTACLLGLEFGSFRETELAFGKGGRENFFDLGFFAIASHGELADQKIAGALQHLFLAERERLGLMQSDQTFQDTGNFKQRSGAHAVRVFLEAVLPVSVPIALGDGEQIQ